jgi:hypothetical protein
MRLAQLDMIDPSLIQPGDLLAANDTAKIVPEEDDAADLAPSPEGVK